MYCKQCGQHPDTAEEVCPDCGAKLRSEAEFDFKSKPRIRLRPLVIALAAALVVFVAAPRLLFQSEMESIGPTDKLRFLRALENSQYKRVGQREFRVEGQTLIVTWDLRWQTLPEKKQHEIIALVGRAWRVVGGETTRFRMDGEDGIAEEYPALGMRSLAN